MDLPKWWERVEAGPPIKVKPLDADPDNPHRWVQASMWGECLVCGGSRSSPIHLEPLEGWGAR